MLRKRAASARLRAVLGDVEDQIRGGAALSQAFASQGSIFPRIYTASILAGERSGALDEVLLRYVTYMRRNVALRRKIRGALAYPLFLLFASGCMVTFLPSTWCREWPICLRVSVPNFPLSHKSSLVFPSG